MIQVKENRRIVVASGATARPCSANQCISKRGTCKYVPKCSAVHYGADVDFTETILRDVPARGIADQNIKLDLLGDQNQDMSLEKILLFVHAKKSRKGSVSRLLDAQGANAMHSAYRRFKMPESSGKRPDSKVNHSVHVRAKECPVYNHKYKIVQQEPPNRKPLPQQGQPKAQQ
ncbi:hypothetical protein ScPMuIL_001495 [Solemya velum]